MTGAQLPPNDSRSRYAESARVIVTLVHGTWARGDRWPALEFAVAEGLGPDVRVTFQHFEWSGANSVTARTRAANDLRKLLLKQIADLPLARHVLIAHSHGGNIVLHAVGSGFSRNSQDIKNALSGIVLLSPPLLDCHIVEEPAHAANKLLVGAFAIVPPLLMWASYVGRAAGIDPTVQLIAFAALTAIWLSRFRPAAVKQRAEGLAAQLALPRLEFPGLIVRTNQDEATFALSCVTKFTQLARFVWSRVNRARSPFPSDERRLREARTFPELAAAVYNVLVLVPTSIAGMTKIQAAATEGKWLFLSAFLPLVVLFVTAALVIVGGALVLLLLMPAFSFLLWPFGISPTPSAALLDVSVEQAPTPAWQVVDVEGRVPGVWNHSVHRQMSTLEHVHDYLVRLRAGSAMAREGMNRRAK